MMHNYIQTDGNTNMHFYLQEDNVNIEYLNVFDPQCNTLKKSINSINLLIFWFWVMSPLKRYVYFVIKKTSEWQKVKKMSKIIV